ncbi:Kinesin-like protein [Dirofilaria immitis]
MKNACTIKEGNGDNEIVKFKIQQLGQKNKTYRRRNEAYETDVQMLMELFNETTLTTTTNSCDMGWVDEVGEEDEEVDGSIKDSEIFQ